MTNCIRFLNARQTQPYSNLALETSLMETVRPGECILYLWQNRHTVVIGRNQNAWKECRTAELERDGGFLARRMSGGGAVFHDLGNLNFTFVTHEADYDVKKQLDVILRAVKRLGIQAEKTGRNDVTAQGRKVSGNAFYRSGGRCYHHGTLLVCADLAALSRYLSVPADKLKAKGIDSVRSRVANLAEWRPELTVEEMREAMLTSFAQEYGLQPEIISEDALNWERIEALTQKFSSWEWNYGKRLAFETELSYRFPWGTIQIQLKLDEGHVSKAQVYSDAMDFEFAGLLAQALKGCTFSPQALSDAVRTLSVSGEALPMRDDLQVFLLQQNL